MLIKEKRVTWFVVYDQDFQKCLHDLREQISGKALGMVLYPLHHLGTFENPTTRVLLNEPSLSRLSNFSLISNIKTLLFSLGTIYWTPRSILFCRCAKIQIC